MAVEMPPAAAYGVVVEILGEEYFSRQPPRAGRRVEVTGLDGITTVWEVKPGDAERLIGACSRRRDVYARSAAFDRDEPA